MDSEAAGARLAQQPGQQQQLQRAWAAPRDPAERVEVSAKFASMPTRTAAHTSTVNSTPGMWDMFHLIRFISQVKGLFMCPPGHMAHNRAHGPRNEIELLGVLLRTGPQARCGNGVPQGSRLLVKVYADLNTFR
ncbi:hypothetical protein GCM10022232_07280 [Streptomyces plumbiresistens]|uniref:Uncharacterized protein n=1 Tax=Streptomyces plumbiresistens TaxID=511811 RepID=A0ABP7Q845_9ACTN